MGGKPKPGGKPDGRVAKNRSGSYKAGDKTKAKGAPTNARDGKTKARVENPSKDR